ncbi:MAG: DUF423 domain-containing protein, partial [Myxococcota bacterium]
MFWAKVAWCLGAFYGLWGVLFGAFGAHALRAKLVPRLLQAFETGVRYQMLHALVLLCVALLLVRMEQTSRAAQLLRGATVVF